MLVPNTSKRLLFLGLLRAMRNARSEGRAPCAIGGGGSTDAKVVVGVHGRMRHGEGGSMYMMCLSFLLAD